MLACPSVIVMEKKIDANTNNNAYKIDENVLTEYLKNVNPEFCVTAEADWKNRDSAIERGWKLFESTGKPKTICAPMVHQSELAFRMLVRRYKTDICYTPMLHSRLFVTEPQYREREFQTCPEDRPLVVQFCANDPDILLQAARYVEGKCDAIDINLGCPQHIAKRGHYGSFLLEEWDLICSMVQTLHDNLSVPVVCKIRVLPCPTRTLELARRLEAAGCCWLVVHGRTKEMIKERIGPPDYEIIRRIKAELKIPVFANGGIEDMEDVEHAMKLTSCEGIMSSEGLLGNPKLFAGEEMNITDAVAITKEYFELCKQYPESWSAARAHVFKFLFPLINEHTHLRDLVAHCKDEELPSVLSAISEQIEQMTEEDKTTLSHRNFSWYRHHMQEAKAAREARSPPPCEEECKEEDKEEDTINFGIFD